MFSPQHNLTSWKAGLFRAKHDITYIYLSGDFFPVISTDVFLTHLHITIHSVLCQGAPQQSNICFEEPLIFPLYFLPSLHNFNILFSTGRDSEQLFHIYLFKAALDFTDICHVASADYQGTFHSCALSYTVKHSTESDLQASAVFTNCSAQRVCSKTRRAGRRFIQLMSESIWW